MSVTRAYLRYRVGRKIGDSIKVTATAAGTTTQITDTIRLTGAPSVYAGRSLYCATATNTENQGEWREVVDSVAGVLTVSPAFPQSVTTGDTFQMSDERDRGFSPDEIIESINDAVIDAGLYMAVRVTEEIATAFDSDTGQVSIPTSLTSISAIYWVDSNDDLRETYPATTVESDGWFLYPGRLVQINGPLRTAMDGTLVTLVGYGPPSELDADSDTTDVPSEWIEPQAMANLYALGIDRDPTRERRVSFYQGMADARRPILFTYRDAGSKQVMP